MDGLKLHFTIPDNVARQLDRSSKDLLRVLQGVLTESASRVRDTARENIKNPPKSGRLYKRGKKQHQASAPGESPATDFGRLAGSLMFDVRYDGLGASVGSDLQSEDGKHPIAQYLEIGTPKGQMKPRPYLLPALEEHEHNINNDIYNAIRSVL